MCKFLNIKSNFYMSTLNTNETTTIKGANLKADDTLAINSKNLSIESVQNRQKSRDKSNGFSVGFGTSGLQSLGVNKSSGSLDSKETLLTDLRGNSVNINTLEQTKLRGATIAAVDSQGDDNSQLTLNTNTLIASSLNNRVDSKSKSLSINIGGNVEENTLNNVALDYSNDKTNQKTKTLATLGSGNINITNTDDSEFKMLNRDIQDNEVDIY
ncbi:MAG: hemagglutinin repeat-containing protein [Sulfurimonas sp.]|uniref:hemagglutinin repeat-containing protein n=1 Tax=Sulfurimonas sp. TaxID=2022749 RepID=UPI00262D3F38|nr:hemagglutinin repeat-containing protein [Sulfurimonas sp.]MDD3476473.1 hemagglutinin repeat-containing protein [Sulfurimonas sp.]